MSDRPSDHPDVDRIEGLSTIAPRYKAVLCDVWGVVHNGEAIYPDAIAALAGFRKSGGKVVLITNSPRRSIGVSSQLAEMNVSPDAFDDIVTSGDVTRDLITQRAGEGGRSVFHLGPSRDAPLFDGLNVDLVEEHECNSIVCTGLFEDEVETPDDYREMLTRLAARDVPLICANPDLVVERGERMIFCAGSLAKLYEELGGKTRVAGKPHKPIYELAMKRLQALTGKAIPRNDVVAIGDGMPTDVAGAQNNGFDLLYISAGIHSEHYGPADRPDNAKLQQFLREHKARPTAWIPRLRWDNT